MTGSAWPMLARCARHQYNDPPTVTESMPDDQTPNLVVWTSLDRSAWFHAPRLAFTLKED